MSIVFLVTAGDYSDYRLIACFTTNRKAQAFIDAVDDKHVEFNDIEVRELNPDTVNMLSNGYSIWLIQMLKNGNTERVEKLDCNVYNAVCERLTMWRRSTAPAYIGKNIPDIMMFNIWAKDKTSAVKIANEKRAQMIANNEWDKK